MSAKLTATYDGETFEVEITSDGGLVFLDRDIEYEIAFVAMGGDRSPALLLLDEWPEDPLHIICYNFSLDDDTLRLLAADWAEHVLPNFEKEFPKDKRPRKAIKAARDFVAGKITAFQLEDTRNAMWEPKNAVWAAAEKGVMTWEAAYAAQAAWSAAWAAKESVWFSTKSSVWNAIQAARTAESPASKRPWQIRHFVHVMGCLQAGKKWPDIKETP